MRRGLAFCIASTLVGFTYWLPAQSKPDISDQQVIDDGYRVKVTANWIHLNTSVWDPRRKASVEGLGKEDFLLYENGVVQQVETCLPGDEPFHLLLLFDVSASTSAYIKLMRQAALHFAERLKPRDELAIFEFSSSVRCLLPFTSRRQAVSAAVGRLASADTTCLYDALLHSLGCLESIHGRKAMVVFSDGADNRLIDRRHGSSAGFSDVQRALPEADCLVYVVFLSPRGTQGADPTIELAAAQLRALAEESGGRVFTPQRPRELARAYEEIAEDLRHIYTLAYRRRGGLEGRYALRVEVKGRPGLSVRVGSGS
ncbi:MAG: VWA domain-containing protein [Acidobacteriota bacterium]